MHVEHEELIFSLPGDWRAVPANDREQLCFESDERHASIVLSVMGALSLPVSRLEEVARKFAQIRADAEISARAPGTVRFQEPWVQLKAAEELAEVAYAGTDDQGFTLRFYRVVSRRKVVSVWVAAEGANERTANAIVDDAIKGLRVLIP